MKTTIEITFEFTEEELENMQKYYDFVSIEESKKQFEDFFEAMYAFNKNKSGSFNVEFEENAIIKIKVK